MIGLDASRTNPDFFREMVTDRAYSMPNVIVAIGGSLLIIAVFIYFLRFFHRKR